MLPQSMAVSHTIAALVLAAAATAWAPPRAARTRILRLYAEGVPAALEGDIRAYLAERERVIASGEVVDPAAAAREAATSNPVWRAGNAMLSLESLLPKESEDDESGDALSYTELQKFGYGSLIEPIMDCGGYVAVSRSLGVAYSLPKKPKEQSDDYVRDGPQRAVSLGGSKEDKLAAIAALNATQIKLDRAAKEARRAERGAAPSAGALRLEQAMREKAARPAAPPKPVEKKVWPAVLAPASLGLAGRAYAVLVLALLAVPGAPATAQLFAQLGVGDVDLTALEAAGAACLAGNVAAAALAVSRKPPRPAFAAARCLFAGPLALDNVLDDGSSA